MSDCSSEAMKPKELPEIHKQLNSAIDHLNKLLENDEFPCDACRIEHEQLREMLIELKNLKQRYQQLEQLTVEIYRSYKSFVLKILRETLHANTDELESKLEELGVDIND